ncbi:hypothetical protein Hanom_Chr05g00431611 [Helianthus anomalus]
MVRWVRGRDGSDGNGGRWCYLVASGSCSVRLSYYGSESASGQLVNNFGSRFGQTVSFSFGLVNSGQTRLTQVNPVNSVKTRSTQLFDTRFW